MSAKLKPKISHSEELLSTSIHKKQLLGQNFSNSFHNPYEIFRNNTTAVEVIIKEIKHKGKRKIITNIEKDKVESSTIIKLNGEIEKLRKANSNLEETHRCFKVILCEMKKQLEGANQRELQTQTENLALQLEKEKLRTLLVSKSNLIAKLKKEFNVVRQTLKMIGKGIRCAPPSPESVCYSDLEYDDFTRNLRNSTLIVMPGNDLGNKSSLEHITKK